MSDVNASTCPQCKAVLDLEQMSDSRARACPFCSWDVSDLVADFLASRECAEPGFVAQYNDEQSDVEHEDSSPPPGDRIDVVEASAERLALSIARAGTAKGLGYFVTIWFVILGIISTIAVGSLFGQGGIQGSLLGGAAMLCLFWIVGFGLLYLVIKFRYERTLLYLDRSKVVVQKVLGNWKSEKEIVLDARAHAQLWESYSQNNVPVYCVGILGIEDEVRFGTALPYEEKLWLRDRINQFLGISIHQGSPSADVSVTSPRTLDFPVNCTQCAAVLPIKVVNAVITCEHCGAVFRGKPHEESSEPRTMNVMHREIRPGDPILLPAIGIDEDGSNTLQIAYPATDISVLKYGIPLFCYPFSIAWFTGITTFATSALSMPVGGIRIGFVLFTIPFYLAGLIPVAMATFVLFGRIVVRATREELSCAWGIGKLRIRKTIAVGDLVSLRVETEADRPLQDSAPGSSKQAVQCVARGGDRKLLLTAIHERVFAQQVGDLLTTRLRDWDVWR